MMDILEEAHKLVHGDRATTHGDALENHTAIAAMWNGILMARGNPEMRPLDAHDVANMMEAMKLARRYTGKHNPDDYIDAAGYAYVAYQCAEKPE
jgi:hypothetical protein